MTSLDDLLSHDEEGRGRRSPAVRVMWWAVKAGVLAAVLAGVVVLALHLLGVAIPYPLVFAGIFVLIMLYRAVRALRVTAPTPLGGALEPVDRSPVPDGLGLAAGRWQTRLSSGKTGLISPRRSVAPAFGELVDERLRLRHGITRETDPTRARALLGEKLWAYLADRTARTPAPRDLAALLTDVEKL